jgi:pimeloyl-ACP methyl ester carboxylesterase
MQLENVILVSHSYGAGPSTEYALRNTGKLIKLIVIDGALGINTQKKQARNR